MPEAFLINFLFVSGKVQLKATILVTLSWDSPCCTHIPTKSCAPALPVLIFLLLTCQLAKTNIEGGGKAVPTNVTGIVACTTDETIKPLVKSVCEPVPKTLFWGPTRVWVCTMTVQLKKLQCIIKLPTRLRGNSKPTSGNSLSLLGAQN